MQVLLGIVAFVVAVLFTPLESLATSQCSGDQIEKMIDAGFTKDEIKELCLESPSGEESRRDDENGEEKEWKRPSDDDDDD